MLSSPPRGPNPLQVLLLALVKYGISTPYELKSLAGMSVGLTLGPLRRLEEAGRLSCERGNRNKLQYTLTQKGEDDFRAALEEGRKKDWWLATFGIFESIPRAIVLAWLSSDMKDARRWLRNAAEDLLRQAKTKGQEAEGLQRKMERFKLRSPDDEDIKEQGLFIATTYQWMKTVSDAALLEKQAELVDTLMPALLSLMPPPPLLDRKAPTKSKSRQKAANKI
jgi:DNA-binding PadR family transcriptional regulator